MEGKNESRHDEQSMKMLRHIMTVAAALLFIPGVSGECFAGVSIKLPFSLNWNDKPASAARNLEGAGFSRTGDNTYKGNFMNREVTLEVSFKNGNGVLESVHIRFNTSEVVEELTESLTLELGEPTKEFYPELRQLQALQKVLDSPLWYFPKEGLLVYINNFRSSAFDFSELVYINTKKRRSSIWPVIGGIVIATLFATSSTILIRYLK